MNTAKFAWRGIVLLLIAAGAGLYFTRAKRTQVEAACLIQTQAEAKLREANRRANQELIQAVNRLDSLQAERALAVRAAAANQPRSFDLSAYLAKHPELAKAFEQATAAVTAQDLRLLYARLHLTAAQIARLDLLLARQVENGWDVVAAAQARHLSEDDPIIQKLLTDQLNQLRTQIQALFGTATLAALNQEQAQSKIRLLVRIANTTAVASEAGMSSEQEEAITQLAVQTLAPQNGGADQPLEPANVDWASVLGRAAAFLTPEQLGSIQAEVDSAHFVTLMQQFYNGRVAAAK